MWGSQREGMDKEMYLAGRKRQAARLREARDLSTTANRLQQLFEEEKHDRCYQGLHPVALTIARHPNAPPELLQQILVWNARRVFQNPVVPFLPLEMPDFFRDVPYQVKLMLTQRVDTPTGLLALLTNESEPVASGARHHIGLAGEISENWIYEVRPLIDWLDGVGLDPRYDNQPGYGFSVDLLPKTASLRERFRAIQCADAPISIVLQGARSLLWCDRVAAAMSPNIVSHSHKLTQLADDGNRFVRAAANARRNHPDFAWNLI